MADEAIHNHHNAEEQEVEAIQAREQRIERMEQTLEQRLEGRPDQRFEELRVTLGALGLRAGQNAEDRRRAYRVVPHEELVVRHISTNRTLQVDAGPYQDGGYDQVVNYCDSGRFQWDPGDNHPRRIPIFDGRIISLFHYRKEATPEAQISLPPRFMALLKEFVDVFPAKLPEVLPPIRGIEHQIDLVPGSALPNRPAYRCNPNEAKELQRQ
ncbi:hypothetical protein CRG98_012030, partial [Punica granatum]